MPNQKLILNNLVSKGNHWNSLGLQTKMEKRPEIQIPTKTMEESRAKNFSQKLPLGTSSLLLLLWTHGCTCSDCWLTGPPWESTTGRDFCLATLFARGRGSVMPISSGFCSRSWSLTPHYCWESPQIQSTFGWCATKMSTIHYEQQWWWWNTDHGFCFCKIILSDLTRYWKDTQGCGAGWSEC